MAIFARKPKGGPSAAGQTNAVSAPVGSSADESRIREIGVDFLARARAHKAGLLSARFYQDKLMDWSMKDHEFKVQLFRFVDAYPVLTTPDMVHEHLTDYLTQPGVKTPPGMDLALKAGSVAKGLATKTISGQITKMAQNFIAGTDAASALDNLRKLWKDGIAFSVDLLGEACVSDAEADEYRDKYLDLVNNLPGDVSSWAANPKLERDHLGGIPRTNVSVKISSLSAKCDPIDSAGAMDDLMTRLRPILEAARDKGVFVNFDMEQFELKDFTLELFMRCCEEIDFQAGLAMQAYLKSGVEDAKRISEWAKRTGRVVTVRLVKGAYWDFETIHAEEMGWACPVWAEKWQTDLCFEDMTEVFLDACPRGDAAAGMGPTSLEPGRGGVKLALGSHNARSIAAALAGMEKRGLPSEALELQMLHGMADQLKHAGTDLGLRVREYVPVGEMIPGMAYLVRRLLENTSNESWLKAGFLDNADPDVLLAKPTEAVRQGEPPADLKSIAPERHALSPAIVGVGDGRAFFNEPMRDFAVRAEREAFGETLTKVEVPSVEIRDDDEATERALAEATAFFPAWRDTAPLERSRVLVEVARLMRAERDALAGVMVKEAGKTWREADADVCEAIDFCEYYARTSPELFDRRRLGKFIGELDETWYQPRGVAAVISPWNFPLAIACGMTAAALVTGNTVILKPAEQTTGITARMAELFVKAGLPDRALHVLYGTGEVTGAKIVRDPRVSLLVFTGSKAVGLDIIQAAGVTPESQMHVKKVVCEMGGKNAIIVDSSADLDEAVLGVRYSAFGFQGQKCSACSRCIVVDPEGPDGLATRTFVRRLVQSASSLVVGDPRRPGTDVAHVIDDEAASKIRSMIDAGKADGATLALAMRPSPEAGAVESAGVVPEGDTRYIGPHIFTGVQRDHRIAREEIFGPVLAVMHAKTFDEALEIANDHPYKLTGGVFSRKPAHIERAKREFRVGNLYINRGCTGALVARQPFGGFGMSGVGSKAGGADYLLQFVEPRACSENTMRRGFAPEL